MTTGTLMGSVRKARRGVGIAGPGRPQRQPRRHRTTRGMTFALFAAPSILLLLLLTLYPLLYAGQQSLRNGDLIDAGSFVGLRNYTGILASPSFWHAAQFTVVFTLVGVFGSWAVGLGLGLLLRPGVPARGTLKVLLLLPWVVPIVVSSTSWNWLVATPQSPLPLLAKHLGFGDVLFLADPTLAQVTVCIFKVWVSFPFMMMMMASALTSIDANIYEASRVDGASGWQTFRLVTLPMIARPTYISWILMTIFCVNDFPTIFLLTGGGPANSTQTLVVLAYTTVFQNFQTGPGVATAFLMTIVLVAVSVTLYRQVRKARIE